MPTDYSQNGNARNARHLARELADETEAAKLDRRADRITPGFSFTHPTQGECYVVSTTRTGHVRYAFGPSGWDPRYATTSRDAIIALIDAGVLTTTSF